VNAEQQRKNLEESFKRHKQNFDLPQDLEDLQDLLVEMTIKPVEVYNFTYHFDPIAVPELGIEDLNEGMGNAIQFRSDIVDKGADLIANVVDKGVGLVSEPIKIIIIAASIVGGIILLFAGIMILRKILRKVPTYRFEHANNTTTQVIPVPVVLLYQNDNQNSTLTTLNKFLQRHLANCKSLCQSISFISCINASSTVKTTSLILFEDHP